MVVNNGYGYGKPSFRHALNCVMIPSLLVIPCCGYDLPCSWYHYSSNDNPSNPQQPMHSHQAPVSDWSRKTDDGGFQLAMEVPQ